MGLYQRVQRPEQVPISGAAFERSTFDMKGGGIDLSEHEELAKDVAAFANAAGGVILVGVDHAAGQARRCPMTKTAADAIVEAYSIALKDRCSPRPFVEPHVIDVGAETGKPQDERFVVAVNVWPFPDQPVGVTYAVYGKRGGPSNIWEAFKFPVRVGTHTRFLRPEELPMLMSPHPRRMAILIDKIPDDERNNVELLVLFNDNRPHDASEKWRRRITLVDVDPLTNRVSGTLQTSNGHIIDISLDAVARVWKSGLIWTIFVKGQFTFSNGVWVYSVSAADTRD